MSQCGSKGSPINIAQMVACVGQQVRARLLANRWHCAYRWHCFVIVVCRLLVDLEG